MVIMQSISYNLVDYKGFMEYEGVHVINITNAIREFHYSGTRTSISNVIIFQYLDITEVK